MSTKYTHYLEKRAEKNNRIIYRSLLKTSCFTSSAFHPEVVKMSTKNFQGLRGKSKLFPCSGSVSLRQLNLIYKKGPCVLLFKFSKRNFCVCFYAKAFVECE